MISEPRFLGLFTASLNVLLLSSAVVGGATSVAAAAPASAEYRVPSFDLSELIAHGGSRSQELVNVLSTSGLLAIDLKDPGFDKARENGLTGFCHCASSPSFVSLEGTDSSTLVDGETIRTTLATATMGQTSPFPLPEQLEEVCGEYTSTSMEMLRDFVAFASNTFVSTLDELVVNQKSAEEQDIPLLRSSYGNVYHSVSSIVKASSNLEHFHMYDKKQASDNTDDDVLGGLHTDAGLFLAFVPGWSCSGGDSDTSFYIHDGGTMRKAIFPPGSIAIMMGAGAENWLKLPKKLPIRATRHTVRMSNQSSRAWYGMMHLVPQSAIVQENPERTFADMREAMVLSRDRKRKFGDNEEADDDLSIGCGSDSFGDNSLAINGDKTPQSYSRRRLQHVTDPSVCNNSTNFFCWMSCLPIPEPDRAAEYIVEGFSLYCVEPAVLLSSGNQVSEAVKPCNERGETGTAHNSACQGWWLPTDSDVPAQKVEVQFNSTGPLVTFQEAYCYGGTSMFMDGFAWKSDTCVIYLFPGWILSNAGVFTIACFGTILMGASVEAIIRARRQVITHVPSGWSRLGLSAVMYGLQLTMGYVVMLVVMTYSAPLFVCVILGLVGGQVGFALYDGKHKKEEKGCCGDKGDVQANAEEKEECCCAMEHEKQSTSATSYGSVSKPPSQVPEGATPCCQNEL